MLINNTYPNLKVIKIKPESIWQNCMPPEARNCLNITRFWHTSPVATPIPCSFRALLISKVRFFYEID